MRDLIIWLNETPWSVALRESFFVWPVLEATHVLTIMLFVGTIIMVDLRLLGLAFTRVPVSEMTDRILPWTIVGFILMVITGLILFYAKPLVYYHNIFFRVKLLVLILALANIWVFHRRIQKDRAAWDGGARLPVTARLSAAVSLTAWIGIVVAGRMIAYDWYECRKLDQDALLATLQDCPAPVTTATGAP